MVVLGVPIATDALKAAGTVVEGVRYDAYLRLRKRHDLVAEKGVGFHRLVTSVVSALTRPAGRGIAPDYTGISAGGAKCGFGSDGVRVGMARFLPDILVIG